MHAMLLMLLLPLMPAAAASDMPISAFAYALMRCATPLRSLLLRMLRLLALLPILIRYARQYMRCQDIAIR